MNFKGNLIATGNTANLYLWNNKIVKVFKENLPPTESLYEAKKQEFAYSCGLNVPKVLEVKKINGIQAIIMEYINGETLGHRLLKNQIEAEQYINVLVNIQKRIHEVKVESEEIERMDIKVSRKIESAPSLNQRQKKALFSRLNSLKYEPRLCHGDLHPFNLIMNEDVVSIIDWVDASAGDIRADVCRTYLLLSQHSIELAELYLHLYCCNINISKSEILQWLPIIAGAMLDENVSSSEENKRLMNIVIQICDG
ncbi:phosphotransferase family protein [Rummeliibacillus stabekisii]|uniref:phosphotransferase family protein n=1 Tax=Rummeliibacillus stabekisii TaxID=241244 RepID=UPI001172E8AE|nr:aminoglycoside phosphotransferase family protein [Rummeliibacillus stabekisii]MBB5170761.1 thiamine kinase-like enzyme [Rummeliibacillus stabekisii]GEL06254.1 aminoglycoside phosphotransferase [Rummeliibacillus stabekisii]